MIKEFEIKNKTESFAQAVYKVARSFVSLEELDDILDNVLQTLGEVCNASRSYTFMFHDEVMSNTHEWCSEGVEPQIDNLKNLPLELFPWWMKKLKNRESINITNVSEMTAEAQAEKEILESQDISSIIVIGLYNDDNLVGFIGIDNVTGKDIWSDETQEYLKVASEIMGSALKRSEEKKKILSQNIELNDTNKKLNEAMNRLIQSEKMAAVGQLAAGVAHELNNPIGFIAGNFSVLREYFNFMKEYFEMNREIIDKVGVGCNNRFNDRIKELKNFENDIELDFIFNDLDLLFDESEEGLQRVTSIVKNLKDYSRIDQVKRDNYDINTGIKNTLIIARNEYKYLAEIETELEDLPVIKANGSEINEVLLNIVVNAAQAIAELNSTEKKYIKIKTYQDDDHIFCEIFDNGPGIPEENLSKIFDPFFTTKAPGKGTGLGLNIAYNIITNKHNGQLSVESNLGEGTTFRIKLSK